MPGQRPGRISRSARAELCSPLRPGFYGPSFRKLFP